MSTPLPLPPGKKRVYYCQDGETVQGPETIDEVIMKVVEGTLPSEISILPEGTDTWMLFREVPDSWSSPRVTALVRAKAQELNQQAEQLEAQVAGAKKKELNPVGVGCAAVFWLILIGAGVYWLLTWLGDQH